MSERPAATDGAKMMYLIARRAGVTREELVANWFANHMPAVIQGQKDQAVRGRRFARRYIATLFDAAADGTWPWDGVAQLWWDKALPRPDVPHGEPPTDTFQEKAAPYVPWATREYVVMDGELPVTPNTLNAPFPATRSGFFKVTYLVKARAGTDYDAFFAHWLDVHVPNVRNTMEAVGGFRYVVSHSIEPGNEPFAGMAELYFPDASGWDAYKGHITADGMETWVDGPGMVVLRSGTEMVGIP